MKRRRIRPLAGRLVVGKFLYDSIVAAPRTLVGEILDNLIEEIDKERLITEESIKEKLQELMLMLQNGEINEQEYDETEAKLMERLKAVREYQKEVNNGNASNER